MQEVKITEQRTLHISVHDDEHMVRIYLRLNVGEYFLKGIGPYAVPALLMSDLH